MALEMNTDKVICPTCGTGYPKRKGFFPVSYAVIYNSDIVDAVLNYIEGRQFGEIINAIEQKIANLAQANGKQLRRVSVNTFTMTRKLERIKKIMVSSHTKL